MSTWHCDVHVSLHASGSDRCRNGCLVWLVQKTAGHENCIPYQGGGFVSCQRGVKGNVEALQSKQGFEMSCEAAAASAAAAAAAAAATVIIPARHLQLVHLK